jgi:SAM-dependent methyltransferase
MKQRIINSKYKKYAGELPYFVDGKLRKDHLYRIYAEQKFYQRHCQKNKTRNPITLDLGCHDAQILKLITRGYNAELIGIDILESVASRAKAEGVDVFIANIEDRLPFKKSYFDIAIAGEIIEHLYNPETALQELNRVLCKNGGLIISIPNICSLRNRTRLLCGRLPYHYNSSSEEKWGDHIRIFTLESITHLLDKTGFDTNSISSNGLFGSGIAKDTFPSLGDLLIVYAVKK